MLADKLYENTARIYDIVELGGAEETNLTNKLIEQHLRENNVMSVLDMTCGTGAQSVALAKSGFNVTGSDLSEAMLDVAREKSKGQNISYYQANMIDVSLGQFDAIISMYNAIGHLSEKQFALTLQNAAKHLNRGGIYIFDIFNASLMDYMPTDDIIDAALEHQGTKYVRYSSFDFDGLSCVLSVNQRTHIQSGFEGLKQLDEHYQLQTYSKQSLKDIVLDNGFKDVLITGEGMRELFNEADMINFVVCYK